MLALVAVAPRVCRPLPLHPILPGVRAPKLGRGLSQVPLRWVLQPQTFLAVGRGPGSGGWLGVGGGAAAAIREQLERDLLLPASSLSVERWCVYRFGRYGCPA